MKFLSQLKILLPAGKLSRWLLVFYLLGFLSFAAYRTFKHPALEKYVKGSDMEGYYQYLPAFFLQDWDHFRTLPWAKPYGEGKTLSVFTCGTALLQAPFFGIAHIITKFSGLPATGYGPIYYFFVFLAGLIYASLGLFFLCKSLNRYFDPGTALLTTSLIFFGTNLFYYTIMAPGMSHVYSFFLISVFIFSIPGFYENPRFKTLGPVALSFSLAVLIRPTNAVAVIYFFLFGIGNFGDLSQRMVMLVRKWYLPAILCFILFLVFIPQMIYWHFVTGHWIVYSYQEESFAFWKNPQIMTVLFGKRGGWYTYTPLMLIATLSLLWLLGKRQYSSPAVFATLTVIIYLDASWWAPAFSASAGYRALIEFIPFLAFPLAFIHRETVSSNRKILRVMASIVIWILVLYNIQFAFKYDATVWWDHEWSCHTLLRLLTF